MKNILKKLGVIGLAIAVLAPFIDLPVVKAASGECTYYLQTYLFLDVGKPGYDTLNSTYSSGYKTGTLFPYLFPQNTTTNEVTILTASIDNFTDTGSDLEGRLNDFYKDAHSLANLRLNTYEDSSNIGNYYVTSGNDIEDANRIALLHGVWAQMDGSGEKKASDWKNVPSRDTGSLQTTSLKNNMQVSIEGAKYVNSKFSTFTDGSGQINDETSSNSNNKMVDYLNDIILDPESAREDNKLYKEDGKYYINFVINRSIDESLSENITDSTGSELTSDSDDIYWPTVLNVEYKVCPTATTGKWDLKYDKNTTESVSNMPSGQSNIDLNTKVKIANGPTLSGKAFTGWCTDKEGKGSCYKADQEITSTTSTTITLYAQWGEPGTTDNKKTGVVSYIIGFISVGAIAGGIYLVSKKKNLFKQI